MEKPSETTEPTVKAAVVPETNTENNKNTPQVDTAIAESAGKEDLKTKNSLGETPSPPEKEGNLEDAKKRYAEDANKSLQKSESFLRHRWIMFLEFVKKARFMRKHILFFVVCSIALYSVIWVFSWGWISYKLGENENWFHEFLSLGLAAYWVFWAYKELYKTSAIYLETQKRITDQQKAAEESKRSQEEERKKKTFVKLITDFESAQTYEAKSVALTKLLTVGVESPSLRQKVVDLLAKQNEWMRENHLYLKLQNLVLWRIKVDLFEKSDRFQVDTATQDLSIKSINIMEAIIKKHITEFKDGKVKEALDLSGKIIPTLTLTAQFIPAGSLLFQDTILWKSSFSEAIIDRISFEGADLFATSFWRAKLRDVDFENAKLEQSKLRTDVQRILHLTSEQFFASKDWELCFVSREQVHEFFAEGEADDNWGKWSGAQPRREKLYFNFQQI